MSQPSQPVKDAPCHFCKKLVDPEYFCFGCKRMVCNGCDKSDGFMGHGHKVESHLVYPDQGDGW